MPLRYLARGSGDHSLFTSGRREPSRPNGSHFKGWPGRPSPATLCGAVASQVGAGASAETSSSAPAAGTRSLLWLCSSAKRAGGMISPVLIGSGIKRPFDSTSDGATSVGVLGLDGAEEFVDVSQHPEEHREEMSPSLAMSRDDDRDDLPEEPPLDDGCRNSCLPQDDASGEKRSQQK
eukprot:CAMPEP_0115144276 /NCGR_PEP_ID=MMETSP0227-20121206/61362_1 /TAXON_ID=89957 /ORGANISM="Polarella glacialis, Strain CCMP 1383" /LENGTH=177 /DNA_ID=CAMNT_0002553449 /DNA_START=391 /DNA_END=924 /DNA_ORIENTATION=-